MASDAVLELTESNFQDTVLNSDKPVLVDFWAEWCAPCRALATEIEEIAADYKDRIVVGKLDTDAHREVAQTYDIKALPTVILFKGGEIAKTFVGYSKKNVFAAGIDEVL